MTQYQTFPDAAGASITLEKLRALRMPNLSGMRFLDVGCNEGFFCGFAEFMGAARVVGLDQSALFIERARRRFPGCEFLRQGWDRLPEGPFDVILLASALHYAEDQPVLIESLVSRLAPTGTLILELGIVPSRKAEWRLVERGIDQRLFPSMPMLRKLLARYAWKWMGPSVQQAGDPVSRHVVHVSPRLPLVYLLAQPPGYGKSLIAETLFNAAGVAVLSGDRRLFEVARDKAGDAVDPALRECIRTYYSPFHLDVLVAEIFRRGLAGALVDLWLAGTDGGDVAIDAYVPADRIDEVLAELRARQRLPIRLDWDKPGAAPLPEATLGELGDAFYLSMMARDNAGQPARRYAPAGFIDEVELRDGELLIRGWSLDKSGNLPKGVAVRVGGRELGRISLESQLRPDVQQHLQLPHALVGYRARVRMPEDVDLAAIRAGLVVSADEGPAFSTSGPLEAIVRQGAMRP